MNKNIAEIQRTYGKPMGGNIGVFLRSSISEILFIIYMGDVMGDLSALNRRSKLSTRIIQDRPKGQSKQLLRGAIKEQVQEEQPKETKEIRTVKTYAKPPGSMHDMTDAQQQRRRNQGVEQRRIVLIERRQVVGEEAAQTETSIQEQYIMDGAREQVDTSAIITETLIQPTQRVDVGETHQFRTEKMRREMLIGLTSSYKVNSDMPTTPRSPLNQTRVKNYVKEREHTKYNQKPEN